MHQRRPSPSITLLAATAMLAGFALAAVPSKADADPADPAVDAVAATAHPRADVGPDEHDLPGPFTKKNRAQRKEALEQVLSGKASVRKRGASQVVRLGKGKYAELGREKTDRIFVILTEFGDTVDNTTTYDPDGAGPKPAVVKYGGEPGPAHNQITQPDPAMDNSTAWQADYDRDHFQDLYFSHDPDKESVAKYYERQSSGRYSVDGSVVDWVKIPYNEARYGSDFCGARICDNAQDLVRDAVNAWVADQKAKGRTDQQIKADLASYDQWDRNDYDGDGDFNEPDGYIDHFQIVHAGEDQSAGGGAQGSNAIWAHRSYVYGQNAGRTGPEGNKGGGTPIGDTGLWVGDYTMQPENGGLGIYAHEYGHDLGLPDHYDTSGTGESSSGSWSVMSQGSWLGRGKGVIGDLPGDMNAWDKLQLGWLDYATAKAATEGTYKLGYAEFNSKDPQALVVDLPDKQVATPITTPAQGGRQWWSGMGDKLTTTLTRPLDLTGKAAAALTLKGWWDIEQDWDFLYTEASTDGGTTWTALNGTADGASIGHDGAGRPALTGTGGAYKNLAYDLTAYAGQKIDVRFRYATDEAVQGKGFAADAITVTADGATLLSDDVEGGDNGWTARGFSRIGEAFISRYPQYYIAENRQYVSYDTALQTGPYNFGWRTTRPRWVEHYPFHNGLLISLWDTSQPDNNVGQHPGHGQILPVDAHPAPLRWPDGTLLTNLIQTFDSPFGLRPTDAFTLHRNGVELRVPTAPGVAVFDDRHGDHYYDPANPTSGVIVPNTNTRITVLNEAGDGHHVVLRVEPSDG
ncbi:immune inhibitor A [Streptomyces sp. NBC_00885]|uniref:immune inhibitor A domain-containing protein n=1 Tax=Streptomyces sp. NBC_00885 TaxID=2975857 RepID=UPI003865F72E|nr:immune inhibitor A [Streptomyces sp. NBC_00885]